MLERLRGRATARTLIGEYPPEWFIAYDGAVHLDTRMRPRTIGIGALVAIAGFVVFAIITDGAEKRHIAAGATAEDAKAAAISGFGPALGMMTVFAGMGTAVYGLAARRKPSSLPVEKTAAPVTPLPAEQSPAEVQAETATALPTQLPTAIRPKLAMGCAGLVALGAMGPWASVSGMGTKLTLYGWEKTDGVMLVVFAIAALGVLSSGWRHRELLALVAFALASITAWFDLAQARTLVGESDIDFAVASVEWGLPAALAGALAGGIFAALAWNARRQSQSL